MVRHMARLVVGMMYRLEEHVSDPAERWALLKQALTRIGQGHGSHAAQFQRTGLSGAGACPDLDIPIDIFAGSQIGTRPPAPCRSWVTPDWHSGPCAAVEATSAQHTTAADAERPTGDNGGAFCTTTYAAMTGGDNRC